MIMLDGEILDLANEEDYPEVLIEQARHLESGSREIEGLIANINGLFEELSKFAEEKNKIEKKTIKEFRAHCKHLHEYVDHLHTEITALVDESEKQQSENKTTIEDLKKEIEDQKKQHIEMKQKYEEQLKVTNEIKEQLEIQKKENKDLEAKCNELDEENTLGMAYMALMGSVLSKMLWKTSKSLEAVETYIETGTMNHFLNLVRRTILAFRETYTNELPDVETCELQFMLSLLGICINILAQNIGREFMLERNIGQDIFRNVIQYMGEIPMVNNSGPLLKRLMVMLLYNLTFTKQGTFLIETFENSAENIIKCFDARHTAEIRSLAVALINQLMKDSQSNDFAWEVKEKLSQNEDDFKMLMKNADSKTKEICTQLIDKIRKLDGEISFDEFF